MIPQHTLHSCHSFFSLIVCSIHQCFQDNGLHLQSFFSTQGICLPVGMNEIKDCCSYIKKLNFFFNNNFIQRVFHIVFHLFFHILRTTLSFINIHLSIMHCIFIFFFWKFKNLLNFYDNIIMLINNLGISFLTTNAQCFNDEDIQKT